MASPLNYLVEILDSAQEAFPYLWVNGKKYEFSEMVLQQGNILYETFVKLKDAIVSFHLLVVSSRAIMSEEYCPLSVDDLQKHRFKVERMLEQFDQDWSIFEKSYVFELMAIEADARKNVVSAIELSKKITQYEEQ